MLLPLLESTSHMVVKHAPRLRRASAFALLLLGACATELQESQQSPLEPGGGSAGSNAGGSGGTGASESGSGGSFVPAGTGGAGTGGLAGAGAGGVSAGSGGGGTGGGSGAGSGDGGSGGGTGGGGTGGAGGDSGGGGMGGTPGKVCGTGKLTITGATASSLENDGFPASNAHDGNTETRWASEQSEPQWIYFDVGQVAHVSRVQIVWEAAYATSFRLEIAQNANGPWTQIFQDTAGNGGTDNITSLTASDGRYVRMYGVTRGTQYGFSMWELEIYGDVDETCQ